MVICLRMFCCVFIAASAISCAENKCDQAMDLCGQSQGLEGDCSGAVLDYARCIVEEGSCTPGVLAKCAGGAIPPYDGYLPNLDGGVNPQRDITLSKGQVKLTGLSFGLAYPNDVAVVIVLENVSHPQPIETKWSLYKLQMSDGTSTPARADNATQQTTCSGVKKLAIGEKQTCILTFYISASPAFEKIVYENFGQQIGAEAPVPTKMCDIGFESGTDACSDSCDNDGNGFVDCKDSSCCSEPMCKSSPACQ